MNSERWQEIDRLFQQAAELEPEFRAAFLDQSCQDDSALRAEVDSLLASDSARWNLIDDEVLRQAAPFLADHSPD